MGRVHRIWMRNKDVDSQAGRGVIHCAQQEGKVREGRWRGMIHPDKSILLAYIRKQFCAEWEGSVQEHIDDCDACHACYVELLRADALLDDAVIVSTDQAYASVVDGVMRHIEQPRVAFARPIYRGNTLSIPFVGPKLGNSALVSLVCCVLVAIIVTFVSLKYSMSTNVSQQKMPSATPTVTPSLIIHRQRIMLVPTPKPTVIPVVQGPSIYECQQPGDDQHRRLHICGKYFTPRDAIQLIFTVSGPHNASKTHKNIVVQDDGTFEDTFSISSCKAVPTSIRAYNQNNLSEESQVLQSIQLNFCSSSANVVRT